MRGFSPLKSLQRDPVVLICGIASLAGGLAISQKTEPPPGRLLAAQGVLQSPTLAKPEVEVLRASRWLSLTRSGTELSIQTNFISRAALHHDYSLVLLLVDERGVVVARVENNLNNYRTILPTSQWVGPITFSSTMAIPELPNGSYSIRLSLFGSDGPVQLTPGPGVTQDDLLRYSIGTVKIDAFAPPPEPLPAPTLDLTGFHLTFDEPFTSLSISDSVANDGARWYARNEQCCMSTTDGTDTAMAGFLSLRNPYSRLAGGGLNIRLQKFENSWTSGVLTSVDSSGKGFTQQYGYFEMRAKFPSGESTWPAFWLLNSASKAGRRQPAGEIDIVEYIANTGSKNYIGTTLHDWSAKTAPAASHYQVSLPTAGFHTYGMMWTASTMTFYFDQAVTLRVPTPSAMKQPYYLLVDLGIGSGYPTERTPPINDMQVEYIRAYSQNCPACAITSVMPSLENPSG